MKVFYPAACVTLLLLSACCTKKECVSIVSGIKIMAVTDSKLLDSVCVFRYDPNTAFTSLQDSFWTNCSPSTEDPSSWYINYPGYRMSLHNDYKVSIPLAGRVFYINQFKMAQRTCNTCLFNKDTYETLDAYTLDGVIYRVDKSSADAGIELHL